MASVKAGLRDREPIAIVGIGCRFPGGANSPAAFWQFLLEGRDAITEVPPDRWSADAFYDPNREVSGRISTRRGGFLENVRHFNPHFSGFPRVRRPTWIHSNGCCWK